VSPTAHKFVAGGIEYVCKSNRPWVDGVSKKETYKRRRKSIKREVSPSFGKTYREREKDAKPDHWTGAIQMLMAHHQNLHKSLNKRRQDLQPIPAMKAKSLDFAIKNGARKLDSNHALWNDE
jgi:hypothetical protein